MIDLQIDLHLAKVWVAFSASLTWPETQYSVLLVNMDETGEELMFLTLFESGKFAM